MARLTEVIIRNTRPPSGDVLLADGGCLFLRIRASQTNGLKRSWVVRIKRNGVRRVHTLGPYAERAGGAGLGIKQARAEAARIVAIERGNASATVREAVELYMGSIIRPKYRRVINAEVYARRLQTRLGHVCVDAVRPMEVSRMIADYRSEAPVAAMRMLGFAKQFFAWCVAFGFLDRSPVADVQASAFGVKEEARERVLTDDEIRALWHAPDLPHRALLRFLLLTGLRIGEAQAARRDWLDDSGWLHLPAHVVKNNKPHDASISPLARKQIEAAATPALFRVVSPTAVQTALRRWQDRHGLESRWTPHDLRRTFASRLGDLKVPVHIVAKSLGHTLVGGGESTSVYLRSEWLEERKHAVTELAAHIALLVADEKK
jgi:integrase